MRGPPAYFTASPRCLRNCNKRSLVRCRYPSDPHQTQPAPSPSHPIRVSAAFVITPLKMLENGALRAFVLGVLAFFAQLSSCFVVVPGSSPVATRYPGERCGFTPLIPRPPVRASSLVARCVFFWPLIMIS